MRRSTDPSTRLALGLAVLVALGPFAGLGLLAPAAAAGPVLRDLGPRLHSAGPGASNSTNWAGYAVTTSAGAVTQVKASWIEPKIQGTCPSRSYQYSAFWVGIDGYNSKTVEQIGTDSDCQGGTAYYYAWYEFYPKGSVLLSMSISPGDTISAQVKYASGSFKVSITDHTTGATFSHSQAVSSAARSSAEWIAEAPSSSSGILPLADFGTSHFGKDATSVTGTCTAKISGHSGPIGSFAGAVSITMWNNADTAVKASPSSLSPDHTSFNVTWKSSGP